eukprot:Gregarina_sp_Pseudo_9__1371@NODE_1918_length_1252_cov_26_276175_g1779_i0_p1_GENE_NODE_1918_length_1252_cov_26_276175_g1779_i0NODE_1918_length_1252_cov_26_276175_g1779_i0_p1_ORF_typecomplete_len324_score66_06RabGAPTBC/PF00566_18/3_4e18KfrA_N/PF11740_8/3_7e03KfrA_N/PF11740_8/0_024Nbl1_Borealin_N/PF10444_9/11Nbl1_Borealin_N/PF10444_9/29_NODE_1918_length_1252_cov_26_276175_g1779_i01971168
MLRDSSFWEKENDSPLMSRNAGFVTTQNVEEQCQRVRALLDLIPNAIKEEVRTAALAEKDKSGNEEMDRLFYQDAVRTFSDEKFRKQEVACLNTVYGEIRDYHQGLGFIVAFLLLFLSRSEVATICLYLDRSLLKGYIKTHNHSYLRDAIVFERLLEARDKELATHMSNYTVPGAYCSKWFIGMNLHVLPFEALVRWFEVFLSTGQRALFQYGLSVCLRNREYLMKQKDASKILELLRFDKNVFANDKKRDAALTDSMVDTDKPGSYYLDIVEHAVDIVVHEDEIERLRAEVEAEMQQAEERRKQAEAEYSDDEIVFSDEEDD